MRNVSDKICREIQNPFYFQYPPPPGNRAVYKIMWKYTVEPDRPQMTVWRMRVACWIPNAANIHSECPVLTAFPMLHWLHKGASLLPYTYIACLQIYRSVSTVAIHWSVPTEGVDELFSTSKVPYVIQIKWQANATFSLAQLLHLQYRVCWYVFPTVACI